MMFSKAKLYLSRLFALLLVISITLVGCGTTPTGLTGNYPQDTLMVLKNLSEAIELAQDAPNKTEVAASTREQINDYISRYRRDTKIAGSRSFTTMQTALNSLAAYYSSYGARPLPDKLKERLQKEFKQAELSIKRGA